MSVDSKTTLSEEGRPPPETPAAPSRATLRRATAGATIGSVVEWFDVAVYGYLAAVLGKVFFPGGDSTTQLLSSFAVFGVAFVVRPLGGVFFGALGDRIGRQKTLAWVIISVSLATLGIGLLPSYETIGVLAPVLLVVLRLTQGFSAGGEMGGASAFVAEYAPAKRRGYLVSLVEMGCILGFLLGSLVVLLLNLTLTSDQIHDWGWRLPFLLTAPLGFIGLYIRNKLEETPEFAALRREGKVAKNPLLESITQHWRAILSTAGYALFQNAALYVILTFVPSHQEGELGYTATLASVSAVVTMTVVCVMIPAMGALSDTVGRRPVLAASCVLALLFSYPLFMLMDSGNAALAVAAHCALGMILAVFLGPTLAAMNELFSTRVRYGGFSLGYNFSVSAFGGTAPFFVTFLVARTGNSASPGLYVMAAALITLLVVATTQETAPRKRDGARPGAD
ncbi:MFS transporter [Streptomyces sp. AJS327]|uniref:MFS transporter n=1 Tax=Streptomyces sp. AJS327 TaxID=2545265 RepID=UPI0015DF9B1C|nr:MFS transporter [Streptomyces sp. AJS327]MBA0051109.1 MFS transporter [Streptomyces sp. AJS327]